jgi:RNA polymerase sigma-70 factor (ECF subfamily)
MPDARDLDLIARAQGGDVEAIGALYDRHQESIFRYLWLRLSDRQLAEDLTGDVFMRMLSALPDYRELGLPFRSWLYRIAHNLLVDHYRKESRFASVPLETAEDDRSEIDPAAAADQALLVERVKLALARLDQHQREVVILRFVLGLSLREAALALDRTEGAVKSLQHRGLAALRRALTSEQEQVA